MLTRGSDWVEERLRMRDGLKKVLDHAVPGQISLLHCFGGLTFFTFLMQVATGIFMAFFYVPTPDHARDSVAYFQDEVPFGAFVRNMHRWGAYLMVGLVVAHMIRVLVHGAYRKPRELNWLVGLGLLMMTLGFGFTGYLLPWDQKAYWATNVGINIAGVSPVIGPFIANFLRGGPELGALTLSRFFALHVFVFPVCLMVGLLLHFAMVRRQGLARPF